MRKTILFTVLFLANVASFNSQTAPDAAELTKLLNDFLEGASRNDAAVHDRFWADDLIYTRSTGVRINKSELMRGVRETPAARPGDPATAYTAEEVKIQQYGNAAVVAFKLIGTTSRSDGTRSITRNLNTGMFIKRDGRWQAVAWQSTVVPDDPPPARSSGAATSEKRRYILGPRGGCHYITDSGRKVYVDRSYCN